MSRVIFGSLAKRIARNVVRQTNQVLSYTASSNSQPQHRIFGDYIARKAVLDEELKTVATLRADGLWGSVNLPRSEMISMEFADLKSQCSRKDFLCLVAVKHEKILGAMDLILQLNCDRDIIQREVQDHGASVDSQLWVDAYATNLVVAQEARRGRVASNIFYLAKDIAVCRGMQNLFLHVAADNYGAIECYKQLGFQFIEAAKAESDASCKDELLLMRKGL